MPEQIDLAYRIRDWTARRTSLGHDEPGINPGREFDRSCDANDGWSSGLGDVSDPGCLVWRRLRRLPAALPPQARLAAEPERIAKRVTLRAV